MDRKTDPHRDMLVTILRSRIGGGVTTKTSDARVDQRNGDLILRYDFSHFGYLEYD